jgi:hypothetical protein
MSIPSPKHPMTELLKAGAHYEQTYEKKKP